MRNSQVIVPKENTAKLVVMSDRWKMKRTDEGYQFIDKKYKFQDLLTRNKFVFCLMKYEELVKHCANLVIDELDIIITLTTKNLHTVTEIDYEYANFADTSYKDVAYNRQYDEVQSR